MRIGFVGYSSDLFSVSQAKNIIEEIFKNELKKNPNFTVVSGATELGIPKLVYEEADKHNLPTIGVMCAEGKEYQLHKGLDHIFVRGESWGDESKFFISLIDKLYRIGGGPQSTKEVEMANSKGISVVEYELPEIKP